MANDGLRLPFFHGWVVIAVAFITMAVVLVIAIVPLNVILQRSAPQPLGLQPDGGDARSNASGSPGTVRKMVTVSNRRRSNKQRTAL